MFVLIEHPQARLVTYLTLQTQSVDSGTADVFLSMLDTEQGLIGTLEYNTDLFNAITRMLGHFQTLLEALLLIHSSVYRTYPVNAS